MKNIKETVEKMIIALMMVIAVTIALVLPIMAAEEDPDTTEEINAAETLNYIFGDYEVTDWEYDGYRAIVNPYIMGSRQHKRFRDNGDFMIFLEKDGDIYTGRDVKVKVVKHDNEAVYVRIVKIKGMPGSKKAFKNSKLIKFWKTSQIAVISPIEREPGEMIPVRPNPTQSENSRKETEFVLFAEEKDRTK